MNTVYLVDDDEIEINKWKMRAGVFLDCGFEICGTETNPIRALEEIRAGRPDVVFSDLKMPELSGVGLLAALRRDSVPLLFVVISAYNEFRDVRRFFADNGGFDYILKPVTDRDLIELLEKLSAKINALPPVTPAETPSRDLNGILEYLKEYPTMGHTLESVGTLFNINPNTVCNLFAKHLNTTFIGHLTALRMARAEELLRSTALTVKDVGVRAGYPNYFYFTRIFAKTHDGMTPTEFREAAHPAGAEAEHPAIEPEAGAAHPEGEAPKEAHE
uniref:Response regulator receiver protein n=1 Tax=uncultured bacterium contig00062 TaxID=1181545 RepID=A0A806K188_9BACT|nr:response regulator receiver protein [uncultured bacterium contig00062]